MVKRVFNQEINPVDFHDVRRCLFTCIIHNIYSTHKMLLITSKYERNSRTGTWLVLGPPVRALSAVCPGFAGVSLTGETVNTLCEREGRGRSCLHCCMMSMGLFPASSR